MIDTCLAQESLSTCEAHQDNSLDEGQEQAKNGIAALCIKWLHCCGRECVEGTGRPCVVLTTGLHSLTGGQRFPPAFSTCL